MSDPLAAAPTGQSEADRRDSSSDPARSGATTLSNGELREAYRRLEIRYDQALAYQRELLDQIAELRRELRSGSCCVLRGW